MARLKELDARPQSLTEMVYCALRDAIVDKTLLPGSTVSEATLARDLNVSKTPVREALLRLRELRLVEADGSRGLRVVRPSREAIVQAYEARWGLEAAATSLAAARADDAQRAALREAAEKSVSHAEAGHAQEFRRWDQVFHSTVADGAQSPYLSALAKNALLLTSVLRARDVPMSGDSVKCAYEHVGIANAIGQSDAEEAADLARSHVQHVMRNVLAAFTTHAPENNQKLA